MGTFEFNHQLPKTTELVNGSYTLTALKSLTLEGTNLLYCLGEATLDNSCCGLTNSSYALVLGELIETRTTSSGPVSTMKPIRDSVMERKIRTAIQKVEQLETVNFYLPATDAE